MKYSQLAGVLLVITLMCSGLMNWAWYPDLQQHFTGYYSYNNIYGKPGKTFIIFGSIAIIFYLVPRIWAKRCNMFLCVLILGYAIKTVILYSGCYKGICPQTQPGLWLMLTAAALMLVASLTPDLKISAKQS